MSPQPLKFKRPRVVVVFSFFFFYSRPFLFIYFYFLFNHESKLVLRRAHSAVTSHPQSRLGKWITQSDRAVCVLQHGYWWSIFIINAKCHLSFISVFLNQFISFFSTLFNWHAKYTKQFYSDVSIFIYTLLCKWSTYYVIILNKCGDQLSVRVQKLHFKESMLVKCLQSWLQIPMLQYFLWLSRDKRRKKCENDIPFNHNSSVMIKVLNDKMFINHAIFPYWWYRVVKKNQFK